MKCKIKNSRKMKGQYRVLMEVLLFAIGVSIAGFVMVSFESLRKSSETISIQDQMNMVLNNVINGIMKATESSNSIVRVSIPVVISGHSYKIYVSGNDLVCMDLDDPSINVTRKIFNMNIPNNRLQGELYSAPGMAIINYDALYNKILIRR